ncbi:cytochrome P450 [Amycolatopsis alkalitolerans]|uniref:Cytochrome P450 n=1 Tax=Amycolatopsis alkalitolerans TaxID=2547244 RepID=A0A5C4LR06_9PSEU|nr:cytochrome P450 [Amycolatopsis alkalitolerans]TNC20603.1 cytochrome P450 [Amycolatopsis alkalitolerans]
MKIDLLAPTSYIHGEPIDQLIHLQATEPVSWQPEPGDGPGYWAVTKYADAKRVNSTPRLFSSFPTVTVNDATSLGDSVNYWHLIMSDPPHHTLHRRHVGKELMPGSVRAMTEKVEQVVDTVIDEVIEKGECDLVADIAGKLAAWVTADLMGLPRQDMVNMYHIADRFINAESLTDGDGLAAAQELGAYTQTVWDDRRANPREDLVTRLAFGEVDGRKVDFGQFAIDFTLIFTAAGDTTRNVVGGGMDVLFQNPDQLADLRADLGLVPTAVEELLRWVTPILYQRRTALDDVEVGGKQIKKGDKVASFFAAANRDPDAFADPLKLDIRRDPNHHLAFGFGPHLCLGTHLARLELTVMFRELMARMPDLEPTGPTKWTFNDGPPANAPIVVGPYSIPVRFTPGPRKRPPGAADPGVQTLVTEPN